MAIRTKSQIIADAISFIASAIPNIATFVGSVVRDLVIESPAEEFDQVYTELSHTQKLQSLIYADEMTTDELDALGANFNLTRSAGRASTGTVTFQISNFSTTSSDVTIATGTVVSTIGGNTTPQVTFVTTQSLFFDSSLAPAYFNPTTGFYEQTATIQAQSIGAITNVGAGTIRTLVSLITGITRITNTTASTGGTDVESNIDFADRIKIKLSGNNVGTPTGIESKARENANVIDAIVVSPNDPEMLRDEFGGEVDVYIIGEVLSHTVDLVLYTISGSQEFILSHQPAIAIDDPNGVTGIFGAVPHTFIQNTDYQFVEDPTTLLNGSTRLQNKIVFNIGGDNPDDGTAVTINYAYDSLIEDLQFQYDQLDAHIVTTDILVKEASLATIDIEADVSLLPGYIVADTISEIQTSLTQNINVLGLGDSIDRSDIISIIESVSGVDSVNVNTLILSKNGIPIPDIQQRLLVTKVEYPRAKILLITSV
jgi:uncharacterized phage protein gp47/JayE